MTCIVGYVSKEENRAYIGGDSAAVSGYEVRVRRDEKVFRVGKFVIGCTSSYRMMQLLRYSFKPPRIPGGADLHEYMCTLFIDKVRECLMENGFEMDSEETGEVFLVAYENRLFSVSVDFQVGESVDGFDGALRGRLCRLPPAVVHPPRGAVDGQHL
jgi:hypothetical protein